MNIPRRNALASLAALPLATTAHGQDANHHVEYLFVQTADYAAVSGGTLLLDSIDPSTLYFSDRPDRIVGHVATTDFIASWDQGKHNFQDEPPNAVLSVPVHGEIGLVTMVLRVPRIEGHNLLYNVEILDGIATLAAGPASLFIDMLGRPATPLSIAGVHRRTRRRVIAVTR